MNIREPIRVLSIEDMERIHQGSLKILERTGLKIDHEKALALLKKTGCNVNDKIVKFPSKIVQESVDRMKNAYSNQKRIPEKTCQRYSQMRLRSEPHKIHSDFKVNAGGFCCFIHDLNGVRRYANMDDVLRSINLVNNLEYINYTGLPVADQNTPFQIRPVAMAAEIAKRTVKFGGIETFKKEDIPYLIEIGTIIKGSLDALKAEPILTGYGEARSPLCIDNNMLDIFMEYIRRGFPQTLDTMPNGGATAPVTHAGNLALGIAETLGAVVIAHAIDENAIIGVDIIPSVCDMQTGIFRYSSPERWSLLVARIQMITEYYRCTSGVHGLKTDGCFYDEQVGFEKAMSMAYSVLGGAVGIGTVGHLENALTFSPQQLVIDNEFAGAMHWSLKPIEVNDDTLALDLIDKIGHGGNFLSETHTLENFRDVMYFSEIFDRSAWDTAHNQSLKGFNEKAKEKARELWNKKPEIIVDDKKVKAIDAVVEHARRMLL